MLVGLGPALAPFANHVLERSEPAREFARLVDKFRPGVKRPQNARHRKERPVRKRALLLFVAQLQERTWDASALSKLNRWRLLKLIKIKTF